MNSSTKYSAPKAQGTLQKRGWTEPEDPGVAVELYFTEHQKLYL